MEKSNEGLVQIVKELSRDLDLSEIERKIKRLDLPEQIRVGKGLFMVMLKNDKPYDAKIPFVLGNIIDEASAKLEELATIDSTTKLYNRGYFDSELEKQLDSVYRSGRPTSLIMLDIDNFRTFNNRYGHEAGDKVLKDVAGFLKENVRSSDVVCRYGGEEFFIIAPDTSKKDAITFASSIGSLVANSPIEFIDEGGKNHEERIKFSMGVGEINKRDPLWYLYGVNGRRLITKFIKAKFDEYNEGFSEELFNYQAKYSKEQRSDTQKETPTRDGLIKDLRIISPLVKEYAEKNGKDKHKNGPKIYKVVGRDYDLAEKRGREIHEVLSEENAKDFAKRIILKRVDECLYHAKNNSKDGVSYEGKDGKMVMEHRDLRPGE